MTDREAEAIRLYKEERWTLRRVARELNTDHHTIRRMLERNNIEITNLGRVMEPFTDEHRRKISESSKGRTGWNRGKVMSESFRRANMQGRLRSQDDLSKYEDYDRLLMLSRLFTKRKSGLDLIGVTRTAFLDRFYFDVAFNAIYDAWIASGKCKWWYPSLDHVHPQAQKGSWELDNLQFLTWFENRAKADMSQDEWERFRKETGTKSALFIESILG